MKDPNEITTQETATSPADTENETFESLYKQGTASVSSWREPGDKVDGKVIKITDKYVFVDIGAKSEAYIERSELSNEAGELSVKEGDDITAYFLSSKAGEIRLTSSINGDHMAADVLEDAYSARIPIEGTVTKEIKGGFEVTVSGKRAFCPYSQINYGPRQEAATYINQKFTFVMTEYSKQGKNIVLSRRVLVEEEEKEKKRLVWGSLYEGKELPGKVLSLHDFGAFVDLGGAQGLIPISELAWGRVGHPSEVLQVGQTIQVKILSIDHDKSKLSCSYKAMLQDPWNRFPEKYAEKIFYPAKITKLQSFGAFAQLEPGIEGLIHISNMNTGKRIGHPKEVVQEGAEVMVRILNVDMAKKKISLSMEPERIDPWGFELKFKTGDIVDGVVEGVKPFGVFVRLENEMKGLLPPEETGFPKGTDLLKKFPAGTNLKLMVQEIDMAKKRLRLSVQALHKAEEEKAYSEFQEKERQKEKSGGEDIGSLGMLLKAKLAAKGQQQK